MENLSEAFDIASLRQAVKKQMGERIARFQNQPNEFLLRCIFASAELSNPKVTRISEKESRFLEDNLIATIDSKSYSSDGETGYNFYIKTFLAPWDKILPELHNELKEYAPSGLQAPRITPS